MVSVTDNRAAVAYARFGLGRRADEPAHGDDAYIRLLQEVNDGAAAEPGGLPTYTQLHDELAAYNLARHNATPDTLPAAPIMARYLAELDARYNGTMMEADTGLTERLVMFWANHFAVSRDKSGLTAITAGAYEREAIRPFVYGRFFDMLLAVETHPTMVNYLDNQKSVGPQSFLGRHRGAGLNENLAREIMELHTLGVRSGYSQADVTAFARVLTGWTLDPDASSTFTFDPRRHEPGAQTIMGRTYDDDGFMQGAHVLRDLASSPLTARHIAFKLAHHFISDTPPPALVDRLTQAFLDTQGDLRAVTRILVQSDEALAMPQQKLRLPQVYVSALQRSLGQRLDPQLIHTSLVRMGQPLWSPGAPAGFSDAVNIWASPVSLAERFALANKLARTPDGPSDPRAFAETALAGSLTDTTRAGIAHAETRPQGLALTFLSPEFMRC